MPQIADFEDYPAPSPHSAREPMTATAGAVLRHPPFVWYLGANGLWIAALTLQSFLTTWLMVGELELSASTTGRIHTAVAALPILATLLGGIHGDRTEPRRLLLVLQILIAIPPVVAAVALVFAGPSLPLVIMLAATVAILQAYADPVRATLLNRAARSMLRPGVSLTMATGSAAGIAAFTIGGQLGEPSLPLALILQAALFLGAAGCIRSLPEFAAGAPSQSGSAWWSDLLAGIRHAADQPVVRNVLAISFVANLFDAGGFILVHPYIVREVYEGNAMLLGWLGALFTGGSVLGTLGLAWVLPRLPLGPMFIGAQVLRALVLLMIWIELPLWGYAVAVTLWGLTMGVGTTCARTLLQETASDDTRARTLSVLTTLFLIAALISPLMLGELIAGTSALTAVFPGIVISVAVTAAAVAMPSLRTYR